MTKSKKTVSDRSLNDGFGGLWWEADSVQCETLSDLRQTQDIEVSEDSEDGHWDGCRCSLFVLPIRTYFGQNSALSNKWMGHWSNIYLTALSKLFSKHQCLWECISIWLWYDFSQVVLRVNACSAEPNQRHNTVETVESQRLRHNKSPIKAKVLLSLSRAMASLQHMSNACIERHLNGKAFQNISDQSKQHF